MLFNNLYLATVFGSSDGHTFVHGCWFNHLDEAMNWVANQPEAYTNFASVQLFVDGQPTCMFAH